MRRAPKTFPFRSDDDRWNSPLGRFVDSFGADELAARVAVHQSAIYHWLGGRTQPRPAVALRIQEIASSAGFTMSLDDIYHNSESRAVLSPLDSIIETPARRRHVRRRIE